MASIGNNPYEVELLTVQYTTLLELLLQIAAIDEFRNDEARKFRRAPHGSVLSPVQAVASFLVAMPRCGNRTSVTSVTLDPIVRGGQPLDEPQRGSINQPGVVPQRGLPQVNGKKFSYPERVASTLDGCRIDRWIRLFALPSENRPLR